MGKVSKEDKAYLLSLSPDDITYDLGMKLFADTVSKVDGKVHINKSRFEPTDEFELKAGEYINRTDILTTVGKFIFNKFIVEPHFKEHLNYVNYTIDNSGLGRFEAAISELLFVDAITTDIFADYLDRVQWLGMQFHEPLASSFTMKGLKPIDKVIKRRDQLIKENKEKLDEGDIMTMSAIEKELVKIAEDELKNDPSMDLYNSGARGSVSNNYKQLSIVKGPVMNKTTGKYEFIKNCFYEGYQKEDIASAATNVVNGAYPKACGTAVSGYEAKKISAAYQAVVLRKDINDCGSKGYIEMYLTKDISDKFLYRYIIDGDKLVMLSPDIMDKYINKKVKIRSILYCGCDYGVCLACACRLYEKLQMDKIGLTATTLTGALLNLKMKSFHDTSVKISEIDLDDLTF